MKVRFFGSVDCRSCLQLFVTLEKTQVNYEYVDTQDERDEIQDFCDQQNVDKLPHLQILNDKEEVVDEHIGPIDEEEFKIYLIKYLPNY